MLAKEPIPVREDESSPYLRERPRKQGETEPRFRDGGPTNVIALRRSDASPEEFEARLRDAFDRALREPLSAAMAVLKYQVGGTPGNQMQAVADLLTSCDAGLADLFDFMVSTATGGLPITRRRVDLKSLCERVLDTIQPRHPEHPIVLVCAASLEGHWDPERIASLLSQLVMNAIHHGVAQRVIRVTLRGGDADALLEVSNHGPPLGDDVRALLQPFVVGRMRGAEGRYGLGLGLYLSREIVRAHGGRLEAMSDAGRTTFSITLPRSYP
jgi:signal transduction histidine kinase